MKKLFKTFFSICMCAVFSVLILPSVSASLEEAYEKDLDQLYAQYCETTNLADTCEWRKRVSNKINEIANSNPYDTTLGGQAFAYLVSKITGDRFLKHINVWEFDIDRSYDGYCRLTTLKCRITTTYGRIVPLKL